ncbi:MAG TPA: glycosyltransferase [Bacteroidales bacterium]|nr:glycosyltransferase [Bacteroidales bacterium]
MEWLNGVAFFNGQVLLFAFGLVVGLQLFYHWFYLSRLAFFKPNEPQSGNPPVSVIICARNEYLNLKENLPAFLQQDYPEYEVIVVNDGSDDDTEQLLYELKARFPHLKVISLQDKLNFFTGKKFPLAIGIRCAKHPVVLLSDADCIPDGPAWIAEMVSNFDAKTEIVIGFSQYRKLPGLLNLLIRYDTLVIAFQYFSFALAGQAYMAVGRNLAYRRDLFFRHNGFISHYHIPSGDDDLFINQAATPNNVRICVTKSSNTLSHPKRTFLYWMLQKRRHLSTGLHYKFRFKLLLGMYSFSQVAFYLLFGALMTGFPFSTIGGIALILFGLRTVSMLIIFYLAGKKLEQRLLSLTFPVLDLLILGTNLIFAVAALFFRKTKWKY